MELKQKNQLLYEYVKNLAIQVNETYDGLMDDKKVAEVTKRFENSPDDLETQIIPSINALVKKGVTDFIELQNNIATIMNNNNKDNQIRLATLNFNTENNGIYLSQQQIDLLLIVSLDSKEELRNYFENICGQFPNKHIEDVVKNFNELNTPEQLEEAKKELYSAYQNSLINYLEYSKMSNREKALTKLKSLGIKDEELQFCLDQVSSGKIKETYDYLASKYGEEFSLKFNHFMSDDFENVQGVSYDEMKSLSDLIQKDPSIDTVIIATGKYGNSVFPGLNGKTFDPYFTKKAMEYCKENNLHVRYHALFDHYILETQIGHFVNLNGRSIEDLTPEEISALKEHKGEMLNQFKWYIGETMQFISQNNVRLPDGSMLINTVEIFNELVEKNKKDKESKYEMAWEKYFGMNVADLISCFPKDENGQVIKPEGVEFMYNETSLTESQRKRATIENVIYQIEQIDPSLTVKFGYQMHLSDEDVLTVNGRKNLVETTQMVKRIQDGRILVDGELKQINPKQTEATEHDFHFTKPFLDKTKSIKGLDLWTLKRSMQGEVERTCNENGVEFERSTYWTIFGKNDHNLCRENVKNQKENLPLVDTMYAGLIRDGDTFNNINSLNDNKKYIDKSSLKGFDQRSAEEIRDADRINTKNATIKNNKEQEKDLNKPKVRVLAKPKTETDNGSKGFSNGIIVTCVTIILAIIIAAIMIYF